VAFQANQTFAINNESIKRFAFAVWVLKLYLSNLSKCCLFGSLYAAVYVVYIYNCIYKYILHKYILHSSFLTPYSYHL